MPEEAVPYWVLISVLFSSIPLTPALAMTLHQAAHLLYSSKGSRRQIAGDAAHGWVRNLKKEALIGTIGGPLFEAELETHRGKARVRFLLTRQGLELMGDEPSPPSPKTRYLN